VISHICKMIIDFNILHHIVIHHLSISVAFKMHRNIHVIIF